MTLNWIWRWRFNSVDLEKDLAYWVECLPMVWETGVQSQFESYQKLGVVAIEKVAFGSSSTKVAKLYLLKSPLCCYYSQVY